MCEYCKKDMESKPIAESDENHAHDIIVSDGCVYTYCDCGRHMVTKIKFCPMCGKKLK